MIYLTYAMPEEAPRCPLPTGCEVVLTGIGKALAMSQLAKALLRAHADMVISVGFCGGLNGTPQGAMVMPDRTLQWDLFLNIPDIPLGHGYQMHCPLNLPRYELTSVPEPVRGLQISGDRFVDSSVHVNPEAAGVDMETASLALLCCELEIPFVSIREVSDVADGPQGLPHQEFMDYIRERGPGYSDAVLEALDLGPRHFSPPVRA